MKPGFAQAECLWRSAVRVAAWTILLLGASGCHHKQTASHVPPQAMPPMVATYPPATRPPATTTPASPSSLPPGRIPMTPVPPGGVSEADLEYVETHTPILTEVGYATWYTAPYKGRRAANGQVFDDLAMTAANRTLPMGSLVEVTNLTTGQRGVMRITDRGPFVEDRMLDLTVASAKAVGIYRVGMARVRMDVFETPKPMDTGGRWCVQIGAFHDEEEAQKLKEQLLRRYPGSNVIEFPGEKSYWVRIRPQGDDRDVAEYIASHVEPAEGNAYLTRLD